MTKKIMQCVVHPEDTGSLVLDLDNETYHCLGCGIKGHLEISYRFIPEKNGDNDSSIIDTKS